MSTKINKKEKIIIFPLSVFEKAKSLSELKGWLEKHIMKSDFYRWTEEMAKEKGFSWYSDQDVVKTIHEQRKR